MKRAAIAVAALGFALAVSGQASAGTKASDVKLQAVSFGKSGGLDHGKASSGKSDSHDSRGQGRGRPAVPPGQINDHGNKSRGC